MQKLESSYREWRLENGNKIKTQVLLDQLEQLKIIIFPANKVLSWWGFYQGGTVK